MKIIYKNNTGLAIITPTGELSIEEVLRKDVPDEFKSTAKIIEDNEIPTDREFRNAWEYDTSITINIEKAKEIKKENLRIERSPLLQSLDSDYIKALEKSESTVEIVNKKNVLRDITKLVDQAKTIEEIKAVVISNDLKIKGQVGKK